MPEGHTLHRLAREQRKLFAGRPVRVSSPQGRFADGAAQLDGHVLRATEAYGKHLLHYYRDAPTLHVHLGLYGKFTTGAGSPPEPVGALRLRLQAGDAWTDLRGPTACELLEPAEVAGLFSRLGPDPLRPDADPARAWQRIHRSRVSIAALLMDQAVLAGIGNVYRAELLFRHRIDPFLPGQALPLASWEAMWLDLVALMRHGVRVGRIETVRPAERVRKRGPLAPDEARYVYRRHGLPCRICGTEVRIEMLVGRKLYWCPSCQAPGFSRVGRLNNPQPYD
ncbi:MAG TPA: DNA-formamidopyrimidine glycosylase family protein [Jatrophihabitans sp.]|nr:DNA-formamidopyrimidine glycosylase family protein [Jatrophihabitans sp.]